MKLQVKEISEEEASSLDFGNWGRLHSPVHVDQKLWADGGLMPGDMDFYEFPLN
jgi:hypothetical protein